MHCSDVKLNIHQTG